MEYGQIRLTAEKIMNNVGKVIIGKEEQLSLITAALIAGGHVLIDDVPGTGKTVLARSLAGSIAGDFSRVQFTPDLLPADVTGMRVFQPATGEFVFVPGPVFTNILLADEINRATPRTQSALLECMQEGQVTEGGKTMPLEKPFLVIATENPVETQGTFPLPEAQLDRFMLRVRMGYPNEEEALSIMRRFLSDDPLERLQPVTDRAAVRDAQEAFSRCRVSEAVMRYIAALCEATREEERVLLGVSPRGMLALLRASQALSAIQGRDYVIPDDVKRLAVPVLAHRLVMKGLFGDSRADEKLIGEILQKVPAPTEDVA